MSRLVSACGSQSPSRQDIAGLPRLLPASVVIAGGVPPTKNYRQLSEALPVPIEYAPMSLCTDNAAMIASLAYFMARSVEPTDPLSLGLCQHCR